MFPRSNVLITGGNFTHTEQRIETAFEKLQKASAPNAFHDSSARFDPPKCHPNTRVAVLEHLMGWVFGRNEPEALILWLYGPAGAGKSAILQTIAELCFERKILLASFFFSRTDATRNHFKPLVATVAYQIALNIPEVKPYIESAVERDPLIFDKSISTQLLHLIVDPLKDLTASGYFNNLEACARLVLIDGLDECDDPRMQSMILRAIAIALRDQQLPLIFLIASRPEQGIILTFNSSSLAGLWSSLVLDDSFSPDADIRLFLTDSFGKIKTTHPHHSLIPEDWPKQSDIDTLVNKSSGQFIYASVVIKYISAPHDRPSRRLEVVLGLRPARREVPFAELDALYMHILGSCIDLETALPILGIIVCTITEIVYKIELLLDLEPGDVLIALAPLNSLINLPQTGPNITLSHASFSDFLVDSSRSSRFYINPLTVKEETFSACHKKLMRPHSITLWPDDRRRDILHTLVESLILSFTNLSLKQIETELKEFSLPHIWTSWSPGTAIGTVFGACPQRIYAVYSFLELLAPTYLKSFDLEATNADHSVPSNSGSPDFLTIYQSHIISFESILRSEIAKYECDVGLMSLIALTVTAKSQDYNTMTHFVPTQTMQALLQLTNETMKFDDDTLRLTQYNWGRNLLLYHFGYLFAGPKDLSNRCFNGENYAQTALRILEFLCAHPPHPITSRKLSGKRKTQKTLSNPRSVSIQAQPKHRTGGVFPRKWREGKHRHGTALSLPDTDTVEDGWPLKVTPCRYGLSALPEILRRSSKSTNLVAFIRSHGKKIAFLPNQTRKVIRAMHEYLDRADEGADIAMA